MSSKKTITVRTEPQEVEIEGNIITNQELKTLAVNILGGNGGSSTADLLRHIAKEVLKPDIRSHAELIRACSYRATCLEDAYENVKGMIWPKEAADEVLDLKAENKTETIA